MTITLAPSQASSYSVVRRSSGTSIIEEAEAVVVVAAMIGLADYYEEHEETMPDAEYRSMRATTIGSQLQRGFLIFEETIGIPLTGFSELDHQLIEQAMNHALQTETDEDALSILKSVAYLLVDGLKIATE